MRHWCICGGWDACPTTISLQKSLNPKKFRCNSNCCGFIIHTDVIKGRRCIEEKLGVLFFVKKDTTSSFHSYLLEKGDVLCLCLPLVLLVLEEDDGREVDLAIESKGWFKKSLFNFYLWRISFVSLSCVSKRMTAERLNWQGAQKVLKLLLFHFTFEGCTLYPSPTSPIGWRLSGWTGRGEQKLF